MHRKNMHYKWRQNEQTVATAEVRPISESVFVSVKNNLAPQIRLWLQSRIQDRKIVAEEHNPEYGPITHFDIGVVCGWDDEWRCLVQELNGIFGSDAVHYTPSDRPNQT